MYLILPCKRHIFHSGRENTQQYSPPEADRHDLPKHADPHDKFALAPTKGCFHAFWSGMIYFGGLYDTKIANRIQSLSPVGQCLQFHPSLWNLIWQHAVWSSATALSSGRHQELLRALGRGQERSALGRSKLLLTKSQYVPYWDLGETQCCSQVYSYCINKRKQQGCPIRCVKLRWHATSLGMHRALIASTAPKNLFTDVARSSWRLMRPMISHRVTS